MKNYFPLKLIDMFQRTITVWNLERIADEVNSTFFSYLLAEN